MIGEALALKRWLSQSRLPAAGVQALRDRKLRAVIRHAYDNVPYYRALFRAAGLSPADIRTAGDLPRIPVTTKDDLRAAGVAAITAAGIDLAACAVLHTTGTTGAPFAIHLTRGELQARRLIEFRALLAIGFRPRDRLTVLGPMQPHAARLHQRLGFYRSVNISPALAPGDQIDQLKRSRPTILWAYPTVLRALLGRLDDRLDTVACPRVIVTSAEVCDDALKARIQRGRSIPTFNFYAANEVGRIAAECTAHEGLHVNEDHVILECLRPDGAGGAGDRGEAVVTSLDARAQPFIRYRLGDGFGFTGKPCSCGSPFPLIGAPAGRPGDVVTLPSGNVLSLQPLSFLLRSMNGLDQYRIVQESTEHLVVELVFRIDPGTGALARLRAGLIEALGEPVGVDVRRVDALHDDAPKFRSFVSRLPVGSGAHRRSGGARAALESPARGGLA